MMRNDAAAANAAILAAMRDRPSDLTEVGFHRAYIYHAKLDMFVSIILYPSLSVMSTLPYD